MDAYTERLVSRVEDDQLGRDDITVLDGTLLQREETELDSKIAELEQQLAAAKQKRARIVAVLNNLFPMRR